MCARDREGESVGGEHKMAEERSEEMAGSAGLGHLNWRGDGGG